MMDVEYGIMRETASGWDEDKIAEFEEHLRSIGVEV